MFLEYKLANFLAFLCMFYLFFSFTETVKRTKVKVTKGHIMFRQEVYRTLNGIPTKLNFVEVDGR